eukprot:8586438-Pyramimonas_sp.AAC.1
MDLGSSAASFQTPGLPLDLLGFDGLGNSGATCDGPSANRFGSFGHRTKPPRARAPRILSPFDESTQASDQA